MRAHLEVHRAGQGEEKVHVCVAVFHDNVGTLSLGRSARLTHAPHLFGELPPVRTGESIEPKGSKPPPLSMTATHIFC